MRRKKWMRRGKKRTGRPVCTREVRADRTRKPHVHMSRIVATRGGWPQVCVCGICMFTRLLVSRSWSTCATTLVLVTVGSSRYVSQMLDEFPDDRLVTFLPGIGVGKGHTHGDTDSISSPVHVPHS